MGAGGEGGAGGVQGEVHARLHPHLRPRGHRGGRRRGELRLDDARDEGRRRPSDQPDPGDGHARADGRLRDPGLARPGHRDQHVVLRRRQPALPPPVEHRDGSRGGQVSTESVSTESVSTENVSTEYVSGVQIPATTLEQVLLEHEVTAFLVTESNLIDAGDLDSWVTLMADDIRYVMPVRSTRYSRLSEEFSTTSFIYDDDLYGLKMRVARLHTRFAWAEDPASRNRHFVSNITASEVGGLIRSTSNVMLVRSRLDDPVSETLTGERRDVLRRTPDGLRLVRREIYMDQTVMQLSAVTTFI
ncbi:3-phenylpropionate/cinnamic acid dioxygenase subunit beta [Nocardioides sp. zg-578]|nr:3-phenylpropionate/cinnamic acid dioxygenase subunit beta [Nocardioides marmotae]